jgi:hypothetical protein
MKIIIEGIKDGKFDTRNEIECDFTRLLLKSRSINIDMPEGQLAGNCKVCIDGAPYNSPIKSLNLYIDATCAPVLTIEYYPNLRD